MNAVYSGLPEYQAIYIGIQSSEDNALKYVVFEVMALLLFTFEAFAVDAAGFLWPTKEHQEYQVRCSIRLSYDILKLHTSV